MTYDRSVPDQFAYDELPVIRENGVLWAVCPYGGWECSRIPRDTFGTAWVEDYMAVHIKLHHTAWR